VRNQWRGMIAVASPRQPQTLAPTRILRAIRTKKHQNNETTNHLTSDPRYHSFDTDHRTQTRTRSPNWRRKKEQQSLNSKKLHLQQQTRN
jgi:hypothetical protein